VDNKEVLNITACGTHNYHRNLKS